jgi:hypothetical protein
MTCASRSPKPRGAMPTPDRPVTWSTAKPEALASGFFVYRKYRAKTACAFSVHLPSVEAYGGVMNRPGGGPPTDGRLITSHRPEGGPPTGDVGAAPPPRPRTGKCDAKRRHGETAFSDADEETGRESPVPVKNKPRCHRPGGGPPTGVVGAAPRRDPRTRRCGAKRKHGGNQVFPI